MSVSMFHMHYLVPYKLCIIVPFILRAWSDLILPKLLKYLLCIEILGCWPSFNRYKCFGTVVFALRSHPAQSLKFLQVKNLEQREFLIV